MGSSLPLVAMLKLRNLSVVLAFILGSVECHVNPLISQCPGEGARYGDFKCIHDKTDRVCAKLVDNDSGKCTELSWNEDGRSFWEITNQERWNWKERICTAPNPGDSWCISLWATANLIQEVGCDYVHIHCESTDVGYVMSSYKDGGWGFHEAQSCLESKCRRQSDGRYVNADEA